MMPSVFRPLSRSATARARTYVDAHPFAQRYSSIPPATPSTKPLIVLALESSADDSSCAIVSSTRQILAHHTISQHAQNSTYGGIHPLAAQAAHSANIPRVIERAIRGAGREHGITWGDVDAVAYTRGPGMKGCLAIGEMAVKGLASGLGKRLVGVHHMQAHALTPLLTEPTPPKYPFLILLVSGGHTQLVLAESQESFKILLDTLDSKIGDAFEKAARLLELPAHPLKSPGAILEHYAALPALPPYDMTLHLPLPVPLSSGQGMKTMGFSFAGLLSALQRSAGLIRGRRSETLRSESGTAIQLSEDISTTGDGGSQVRSDNHSKRGHETLTEADRRELSKLFQNAAISHLTLKLSQAITSIYPDPKVRRETLGGLVVSGGVASNLQIRRRLGEMVGKLGLAGETGSGGLFYPPVELCTDNAAMIAWTAILRLQSGLQSDPYDLPLKPRWSLEDLYDDLSSGS